VRFPVIRVIDRRTIQKAAAMSLVFSVGDRLDRVGLRSLVARLATQAYRGRSARQTEVSVDREGRWVNCQPEASVVSPTIHTTSYAAFHDWVLDNWCWGYLPKEGDVVVDVGAGIGEEAIVFSHLVGPREVISIEAHPAPLPACKETVRRLGPDERDGAVRCPVEH
jgi:hypothetical protein